MKNSVLTICISALILASCTTSPEYENFAGFAQGTTYSVVFEKTGKYTVQYLSQEVEKILHEFDMSLSLYKDSSILSKVNRNEQAVPDRFFIEVFERSRQISELTGGMFDITVGPLVKAWGFGPDEKSNFSEEKRDSLLQLIGYSKVRLENGMVVKDDPAITLDFNAIAQGYSVDVIYDFLKDKGIPSFLVEIGGEVRVRGDKGGTLWRIGIDKPADNNLVPGNELQAVLSLKDRALATSGNYRKFYVMDGVKYSHTIDPRTGYPARNTLLSATVVAADCTTADGIATAFMVMGKDKTIEFLDSNPEFEAFLIYSDGNGNFMTWISEDLKKLISDEVF